jgi:hypothetical protein
VLQTKHLLLALIEHQVDFVMIGGMAAVAQGSAYVTADLDVCYRRQEENYIRLSEALAPFKPRLRGAPEGLPFVLDAPTLKAGLNFTLTTEAGDIDLIGEVTGLGRYENVRRYAEELTLYGQSVRVLNLDGLILSKEAAGRPKDLTLLQELRTLKALRAREEGKK